MPKIYLVGGSKGGVGKSFMSMALLDYLQAQGKKLLLIESDTSNPDSWKAYKDEVESELVNLDEADGWIRLVNLCEQHVDSTVVVNTAARNMTAMANFGETLHSTLGELKRDLTCFWMVNRQRDSLELLKKFTEIMPSAHVHVVRNLWFGDEPKFELYNTSKIREGIEKNGGRSLNLPDLAARVSDDIYSGRMSIARAAKELPIGNRAELNRWRNEVKKMLAEVANE